MFDIRIIPNEQTPVAPAIIEVNTFIADNYEKLKSFLEFAKQCENAVGLAANQVSINGERFNVAAFALKDLIDGSWKLIINPIIEEYVGLKETKCEGCLTWINKTVVVDRYRAIKVSYFDIDGNKYSNEIYKGFEGQVWQHEINHINGINERIEDNTFKVKPLDIQRNDICPCKSGKKYKQCCLQLI